METNDKLIVEFLGYIDNGCSEEGFLIDPKTNYDVCIDSLQFHKDWNWLMEVVEKIESIKIETYKVRVDIYFNCCQINPTHWEQLISIYGNKETKIEAVYNACIEFIKWYNENSAKEK